jgi:hypothetical protein
MRAERLLNPAQRALRRLDEAAEYLNTNEGEEFSLEIADTVRGYLMKRFELETLPQSLSEFARTIPAQLVQHQAVLERFASLLDIASSMGFAMNVPDLEAMRDAARHVIIRTTLTGNGARSAGW